MRTVGTMQAGTNENIIPDRALLRLNVRTFKEEVRSRVLGAIRRILEAEAVASGAPKPPEFSVLSEFPLTRNDEAATKRVVAALEHRFGTQRVSEVGPATASEDFGLFGTAWNVPSVFWVVGGIYADTKFERMAFLAAVKEAKLRSFVVPGQLLSITAKVLHEGSGFAMTTAAITVGGKATCEAELTLRVMPFPDPRLRANMEEMAGRIGFPMKASTDG